MGLIVALIKLQVLVYFLSYNIHKKVIVVITCDLHVSNIVLDNICAETVSLDSSTLLFLKIFHFVVNLPLKRVQLFLEKLILGLLKPMLQLLLGNSYLLYL